MKNSETISVQLRKEKQDGVSTLVAIFPYEIANYSGDKTCFTAEEGHSACHPYYHLDTKPCTEEEAKILLNSLKNAGYDNLKVIKRAHHATYLNAREQNRLDMDGVLDQYKK